MQSQPSQTELDKKNSELILHDNSLSSDEQGKKENSSSNSNNITISEKIKPEATSKKEQAQKPFNKNGLLSKCHLKLATYIEQNKDVTLAGTKRFTDKSGEYYLKNVQLIKKKGQNAPLSKKLSLKSPQTLDNCFNILNGNLNKIKRNATKIITVLPENSLTPIPVKEKNAVRGVAGVFNKKQYQNAERTAVFIRRMEYSSGVQKHLKVSKKIDDSINKIILIQEWWKTMYKIIRLQKCIRGFLFRRKLMKNLEHQERLLQFITNFGNIHGCHLYKIFFDKLKKLVEQIKSKKTEMLEDFSEKMEKIEKLNNLKRLKNKFLLWKKKIEEEKKKKADDFYKNKLMRKAINAWKDDYMRKKKLFNLFKKKSLIDVGKYFRIWKNWRISIDIYKKTNKIKIKLKRKSQDINNQNDKKKPNNLIDENLNKDKDKDNNNNNEDDNLKNKLNNDNIMSNDGETDDDKTKKIDLMSMEEPTEIDEEPKPEQMPKKISDRKKDLLLDLLKKKDNKDKLKLWKAFCIWRGNALDKYKQTLKFMKQGSLKNLDKLLLKEYAQMKNPRYSIIATKKILDTLFYNKDALKDAFNKWKNLKNEEELAKMKAKLLYNIYKNHHDDKIKNILSKYKDKSPTDILKENNGEYPDDIKSLLKHYFDIWKNILDNNYNKKMLDGDDIIVKRSAVKKFKENKFKNKLDSNNLKGKDAEDLKNKCEIKDNDLIVIDPKGNVLDVKEWGKEPLKRLFLNRYKQEKYNLIKNFYKWYYLTKLMQAIERLSPIIEGLEKLINYLKKKPAQIFFKILKLNDPEKFYSPKLQRLANLLKKLCPTVFDPYKTFLDKLKLFNRAKLLKKLLDKIDKLLNEYYLRKYLNKWKDLVNNLKEEKRKLFLSLLKKKMNDEKELNNNRRNELLRRILDKDNKILLLKFKQAFKLWALLSKVPFLLINGNLATLNGKEITPENLQKILGKNLLDSELSKNILNNNEQNNNATPEEKKERLKEILNDLLKRFDSKNGDLLRAKLYQWKSNSDYLKLIEGVKAIQRYTRRKLGHRLQKKRKQLVDKFAKKLVYRRLLQLAQINTLKNTLKYIYSKKVFEKLKSFNKKNNQSDILKKLLEKADENRNKLLLKTYFSRWKNISNGLYNKEDKSITKIQSAIRSYLMKKKAQILLKRKELLNKFIKRKEHRSLLEYFFRKWQKNAMLDLCDESATLIQTQFRKYNAKLKLDKLKENADNYKNLCDALSHIKGQPKEFFDKMKKIRRAYVLGDLAQKLDEKRKNNLKDAFDNLKTNNKLNLLKNIINKTDDRENNKLKYYLDKWRKQAKKGQNLKNKIGNLFDKKDEKENLNLNCALNKWLYKAKLIKCDINQTRIGFFCKKILHKLDKEKELKNIQNKWRKLSNQLLHGDINSDIKDILKNIKYLNGLKKAENGIVKKNRKNVLKKLMNNDKENIWKEKMKNILDFMNKNNLDNNLNHYLNKWKNINDEMNKKEKKLENAMEILDYINKLKKIKTLNDVFLNKRLFNTIKNIKALIALRKLKNLAKEDRKNSLLGNDLNKVYKEFIIEYKDKLMIKIYKMYVYKILDNLIKKLYDMLLKKSIIPKNQFMNKLNKISINDKEFSYRKTKTLEREPKINNLQFRNKPKENKKNKLLNNNIKSNAIAFNVIIPELLDYLNDIFLKRKKDAYDLIKDKSRNELFTNCLKSYLDKKILPEKKKLYDNLQNNKRILLSEGPLKAKLFKLLRKKALNNILNKDDLEKLSRLLKLMDIIKLTKITERLIKERFLKVLIRKWRFIAFSLSISKQKLSFLYKYFHAVYLEIINNVFGEQESNPSVIKEFERFGSSLGLWQNDKPEIYSEKKKFEKLTKIKMKYSTAAGANLTKSDLNKEEDKKSEVKMKEKEEKYKKVYEKVKAKMSKYKIGQNEIINEESGENEENEESEENEI